MMQNGAAPLDPAATAVMAQPAVQEPIHLYSHSEIIELTNTHEKDVKPLVDRMDRDYRLYRLEKHVNRDRNTELPLADQGAVYTSNTPKVFADKVISWQSLAELLIRVPHIEPGLHDPGVDDLKERFAIGLLRAADDRLISMLQPKLRGAQATFVTLRGGYVGGRALLVKRPDGSTYADITAWDPEQIHWGLDQNGLAWVCHKVRKTWAQIRTEYGAALAAQVFASAKAGGSSTDAEASGIWTFDFYDAFTNQVVTDSETLKPPTPHGSPRVPCYLALVGPAPVLQSQGVSNLIADVGESAFSQIRELAEKHNDVMSIMLEIVARARDQTIITESADGRKTLNGNPFEQGTVISTRTGERIYTLDLQRMAQETGAYMQVYSGEYQRGTLPFSSYGETPFQLSGFAITQLRQATETVLSSRIAALQTIYLQIVNLLYDQFMTGAFEGVKLSGVDSHRRYFNQRITPEMLHESCDYTVELKSQLPQDDQGKWQMADVAKRNELLSDIDILDSVLELEDSQQAIDKLRDQKAQQGLPEAVLYTLGKAAAERGDKIIANMYLMEYQRLMAQKWGLMPPDGQTVTPEGDGGAQGAKGKGPLPTVMPNAMTGAAPQPETSNNGPSMIAPGTPRPGAQGQQA